MQRLTVTVRRATAELVIDRLLPIAPMGVRERARGDWLDLTVVGREDALPALEDVLEAAGEELRGIERGSAEDDWRERRRYFHEPVVVGGRIALRPDWADPVAGVEIEVVFTQGGGFGTGSHPTTVGCLEMMLGHRAGGSFADLGCGSGVLAIAAAKLGFAPVEAVDHSLASVAAAKAAAAANGVAVAVRQLDLMMAPPPTADTIAANVPASLHREIAGRIASPPRAVVASGFGEADADAVVDAYGACGLTERRRLAARGWDTLLLERG